eukprot:379996_1
MANSKTELIVNEIICTIAFAHCIIILTYHSYALVKFNQKLIPIIQKLSILSIILTVLMETMFIMGLYTLFPKPPFNCQLVWILYGLSWLIAKFSLYCLFLERLFMIFRGSSMGFKKSHIFTARVMLLFNLFLCIILAIIFIEGSYNEHINNCSGSMPFLLRVLTACNDAMICSIICILLSRRLLLLSLSFAETEQKNDITNVMMDDEVLHILSKTSFLCYIMVVSTTLSLIFSGIISMSLSWLSLDFMVNCWCVLLMFAAHQRLYTICCSECEKLMVTIKCLSCLSCNCCCQIKLANPKMETAKANVETAKATI